MTVYDYVLKSDNLISYSYFLTLVKLAYPDVSDWCLVLTFSYPENQRDVSGIPNNPIYGAFVSKEDNLIIDVYCETTNIFGGLQSFKDLMKMNIEQQKSIYDKSKKDNIVNMSQVVTLYTFDKEYLYNEFLESYMAGEKLQYELKHKIKNTPKKSTSSKPKSKGKTKTDLPSSPSMSSISSLELDDEEKDQEETKETTTAKNKSKKSVNSKPEVSDQKLTQRKGRKKGKDIEVEQVPLNPDENKKPDSAFMKKCKEIQKTRTYRTIENIFLFFIIFICVKYYSVIISFIYSKSLSIAHGAIKLLKEDDYSRNSYESSYEKYESYFKDK